MAFHDKVRACLICGIIALTFAFTSCQGLIHGVETTGNQKSADLQSINHIVFMAQENRSLDSYFGQLPAYWAANGFPAQPFDGMPMNPPASNPTFPDATGTASAFHFATVCVENLSPSWNESHVDWNLQHPVSGTALNNGFVWNAGNFATNENKRGVTPQYTDTTGIRAMGFYDGNDLNYYYFMASNFATSDRWFAPALDRTQVSRLYLFAATSQGYAYPPGFDAADNRPLTALTIFDGLNKAGVSWKIYYSDDSCQTATPGLRGPVAGLAQTAASSGGGPCTYLRQFAGYAGANPLPSNVVPVSQYFADLKAGTLPSVAFIEPGFLSNRDEHPSPGTNVQDGATYVESLINALMTSSSWKDSVFILTYDEPGGFFDHVPAQPSVNPDGIAPIDLQAGDVCSVGGGSNCNFNTTGFRVPLLVISPFAKRNYVSHTVADYTAILKFIETRFNMPSLTKRDAAQMDMTEFFDFQNVPWATPPSPPQQSTSGVCDATKLQ